MSKTEDQQPVQSQPKPKKESSKSLKNVKLPALLEFVFTLSNLILVIAALAVAVVSYISGASVLDIALRTGVTLIVVGVLMYVIARKVANASLDVTNKMLEDAVDTQPIVDKQG